MHLPFKIDYSNVYEYRYIKIYCLSYHHNEYITQLVLFHGWIRLTKNGCMEDVLQMKVIYDNYHYKILCDRNEKKINQKSIWLKVA